MENESTLSSLLQYLLNVICTERTAHIELQTKFEHMQSDFNALESRFTDLEQSSKRGCRMKIYSRYEFLERRFSDGLLVVSKHCFHDIPCFHEAGCLIDPSYTFAFDSHLLDH